MSTDKKIILVVGATGAQGMAVIDALLAPKQDGHPSPYAIRALTRDPSHRRAQELSSKDVDCYQGYHFCLRRHLPYLTRVVVPSSRSRESYPLRIHGRLVFHSRSDERCLRCLDQHRRIYDWREEGDIRWTQDF